MSGGRKLIIGRTGPVLWFSFNSGDVDAAYNRAARRPPGRLKAKGRFSIETPQTDRVEGQPVKVLLQRVRQASVRVEGSTVGRIDAGLLVLLGVEQGDTAEDADYMADKTALLRIFRDEQGRMNRSVEEADGSILVVSQFTLAATTRKGRRPSYNRAAPPETAEPLYRRYLDRLRSRGLEVESGVFQAMMEVESVNDGPVTIMLDPPLERETP